MTTEHKPHIQRHAPSIPAPVDAALAPDPELWLAWAPLAPDMGSCRHEACESDEARTCQEPLEDE